jgi:putative peptidoglycan lipid II flippase
MTSASRKSSRRIGVVDSAVERGVAEQPSTRLAGWDNVASRHGTCAQLRRTGSMRLNVSLGAVAAANLLAALGFQWVVLTTLGVGSETDALFAGMVIPQLVLSIVSGALVQVLTPMLSGESEEALRQTAWGAFLLIGAGVGGLALALGLSASVWVGWLLPGFRARDLALAVSLTRIQLPGMVFMAAVAAPLAGWNARGRFVWAEIAPFFATLLFLVPLPSLLARYGVEAAGWASSGKALLYLLLVLPGLGAWKAPDWSSGHLALIRHRIRPLLGGNLYFKSDALVDRSLSSLAPPGDLSILYLAQQLWNAGSQVLTVGIGRPMVPALATLAKEERWAPFADTLRRHLVAMAVVVSGSIALLAVAGRPALDLLIGHGGVTAGNVSFLWKVMLALALAFAAGCVGQLTSQGFYALGDTRTPTRIGVVTFTLYVPLKFLAFRAFGIYGLAGSTGLFVFVNLVLQSIFLRRSLRARGAA